MIDTIKRKAVPQDSSPGNRSTACGSVSCLDVSEEAVGTLAISNVKCDGTELLAGLFCLRGS